MRGDPPNRSWALPNCELGCSLGIARDTTLDAASAEVMQFQKETLRANRASGCHASWMRTTAVRAFVRTVKKSQQRQAPLSGSPAKRICGKKLESNQFLRLRTFAGVAAGVFLFNLI